MIFFFYIINNLEQFSYLGTVPKYQSIEKQRYMALVCKQNIVFYKVNEEKKIVLHIIVYVKRNVIT